MDHNGNPIYDKFLSNFSLPSIVDSNINTLLIENTQQYTDINNINDNINILNNRVLFLEGENIKLKEIIKKLLNITF
jgi:hypothetical protein